MFDAIYSLIKIVPNWIIAITACLGLGAWRRKISYEKKMSIVDDFHESVTDFRQKTKGIVEVLKLMKISIQSYEDIYKKDPDRQKNYDCSLQEFMEKAPYNYSSQLQLHLSSLPKNHIHMLSTKIVALNMQSSNSAINCCNQLNWFYDTVNKTIGLLSIKNPNWKNPELKEKMQQLNELDIKALEKSLNDAESMMMKFTHNNYSY